MRARSTDASTPSYQNSLGVTIKSVPQDTAGSLSFTTINGGPATAVHAADGRAQITFTPTESGWYNIEVTPIAKDGTKLFPTDYFFG